MKTLYDNVTDKKYTLVVRNEVTLNWNDLDFLRAALETLPPSPRTFINFNEPGIRQYVEENKQ